MSKILLNKSYKQECLQIVKASLLNAKHSSYQEEKSLLQVFH